MLASREKLNVKITNYAMMANGILHESYCMNTNLNVIIKGLLFKLGRLRNGKLIISTSNIIDQVKIHCTNV